MVHYFFGRVVAEAMWWLAGWVLKVRIRLSQLSTKMYLKLKRSLAKLKLSCYYSYSFLFSIGGHISVVLGFTVHFFFANLSDRSHLLSLKVFRSQLFSAFS